MSLFPRNRVLIGALAIALTMLVPTGAAFAAKPGNSAHAKSCYKGHWTLLATANGTSFANQSDCVAYGATGGSYAARLEVDGPCCDSLNDPEAQVSANTINGLVPDPIGEYFCGYYALNSLPCHAGVPLGGFASVVVTTEGSFYGGSAPVVTCPDGSTPTPDDNFTYWSVRCYFFMDGPKLVTITF